jgi:hypothetical protein
MIFFLVSLMHEFALHASSTHQVRHPPLPCSVFGAMKANFLDPGGVSGTCLGSFFPSTIYVHGIVIFTYGTYLGSNVADPDPSNL